MDTKEPDKPLNAIEGELLAAERRSSERRPPSVEPTYVWVSLEQRIQTRMQDQSDGGLAVLAPRSCNFEIGFQIRVEVTAGVYRMAKIVYVGIHDETRLRLGLKWEDAVSSD